MSAQFLSLAPMIGSLLLGGAFVYAGLRNLKSIPVLAQVMTARGVPQARAVLLLGIAVQVICGLLVAAGIWTVPAASALILFLIVATLMFHNFWDHEGLDRTNRINGWISNIALIGAFVLVIAMGR